MLNIHELQPYLIHTWTFKRAITHHLTGQTVTVEGHVTWQPQCDAERLNCFSYLEQGKIQIGDYVAAVSQTYRTTFPTPVVADIYFNDGRFFYTLDLSTGECDIHHLCGQDTYQGHVAVVSETEHHYVWRVNGPRKDYTSNTAFCRVAPGDGASTIVS